MHQNVPFFMKKRPTMALLWSKVGIFGLSPILRALDAKKQIDGTHRSRKHNLQHPYAPKCAVFTKRNGHKWPFSGHILIFLASYKQLKDPPPLFGGCWMQKGKLYARRDYESTIYSICMHQNLLIFMEKLPKMAVSWSKIEYFGLRQAVAEPPPPI